MAKNPQEPPDGVRRTKDGASESNGEEQSRADTLQRRLHRGQDRLGSAAEWLFDGLRSGAESARDRTAKLFEDARSGVGSAIDWGRELPSLLSDLFVSDCAVPVFLLPTGPAADDFVTRFDFSRAVGELTNGVLVRPRLEVWVARPDIDRAVLGRMLKQQFKTQLDEQRAAAIDELRGDLVEQKEAAEAVEERRDREGEKLGSGVARVSAALIGMFFVANPIFDLLFLTLALFGGSEVVRRFGSWFSLVFSSSVSRKRLEREEARIRREVDRELDASTESFREAVGNLDIRIHSTLQRLGEVFSEVELTTFPSSYLPEDDPPEVRRFLSESGYLDEIPEHLRPIVEATT